MNETVVCKFVCQSVKKYKSWVKAGEFLYDAEFTAVTTDSEENKQFFAATPSGTLHVATVKADMFVPGQAYFLDITPAT